MRTKLTQEDASRILSNVTPENCFWINNGPIVGNISELPEAIEGVDDDTFRHHLNNDKNDFAVWIAEVLGDHTLAKRVSKSKSKRSFINKLRKRISTLQQAQ